MKKLTAVILTLALLLAACGGMAESIFDALPEDTDATRPTAPSYSILIGADPDRVEENAEGGAILTYNHTDASGYNRFGTYLGKLGFTVTGKEKEGKRIAYSLSDGQADFVMIYDQGTQTMQLIYPKGTDYAGNPFPGYTWIDFDEEVNIPKLGRFTFRDFVLDGQGGIGKEDKIEEGAMNSWLSFSFYNTSATWLMHGGDLLFDAIVTYQNADGIYEYKPKNTGAYLPGKKVMVPVTYRDGDRVIENLCASLSGMEGATLFDLPAALRASSDGTIAIKLHFFTGEKYVLVIR